MKRRALNPRNSGLTPIFRRIVEGRSSDFRRSVGTNFQSRVLEEVLKIPFGEVRTYSFIAQKIGFPKAVRAVGSALKKNPYPILIPCHRVVKSNGDIGQYSGGKNIKGQLIKFERRFKEFFCQNRKKALP